MLQQGPSPASSPQHDHPFGRRAATGNIVGRSAKSDSFGPPANVGNPMLPGAGIFGPGAGTALPGLVPNVEQQGVFGKPPMSSAVLQTTSSKGGIFSRPWGNPTTTLNPVFRPPSAQQTFGRSKFVGKHPFGSRSQRIREAAAQEGEKDFASGSESEQEDAADAFVEEIIKLYAKGGDDTFLKGEIPVDPPPRKLVKMV